MKTFTLLLTLLITVWTQGFNQDLQGTIRDVENRPIQGAEIYNLSNGVHAHSNEDGRFTLQSVTAGDTLRIFRIGYNLNKYIVNTVAEPVLIQLAIKRISIDEIVIKPKLNASRVISDIDLQVNPVNSSQDILQEIPGLIIGQHAGGGKAEQIFLRGFDIDHGTDLAISADGMPVNMVSHAHGQGYSDLHFIIPETIEKVDFGKGPYYAGHGDFTTAGYIDFRTKNELNHSTISAEIGQFNTYRLLGMIDLINTKKHKSYIATEHLYSDGFVESPQNFNRTNIFGKYTAALSPTNHIGITFSHFTSEWDASGQIPQRAVDAGLITRYGAIDDTEGGKTGRTNLMLYYDKTISGNSFIKTQLYYSLYNFELFSNFTFHLENPENGDQIRQKENRNLFGFSSTYHRSFSKGTNSGLWRVGINLRNDVSRGIELSHTTNRRETLQNLQLGDIYQTNLSGFSDLSWNVGKWTFIPGVRLDYFDFEYQDALLTQYSHKTVNRSIVSPKLNILYNASNSMQWYLKTGKGFHSNDARVSIPKNGKNILPAAYGADLGFIWKPLDRLLINTAYWYLFSEQEFVYVGDAGIVEPGGQSRRQGVDLSLRYQPTQWLFGNLDVTYTHARSVDEPEGQDYIPLAPDFTLTGGANFIFQNGLFGGLQFRHINHRPANENYSITAAGYTVVDLNTGLNWKNFTFGVDIENLLDTEWNETQFATESRLKNEISPVEEIHFIPGTPFSVKGKVAYRF